MSVTLVHTAKAVERNEMPFDRDTGVVPSNIVLDRATVPIGREDLGNWNPQFAMMPPIAELLWPLLLLVLLLFYTGSSRYPRAKNKKKNVKTAGMTIDPVTIIINVQNYSLYTLNGDMQ